MLGKTNQMTVKEMFILMLMTIRGVSLEKAVVIQNRFPTPKSLLEYYHTEHATTDTNIKRDLMMNEFKDQIGNKKLVKLYWKRFIMFGETLKNRKLVARIIW